MTAIVPYQSPALDAYTPRDMSEAMALAKTFAASRILGAYGTTEQVMLVMAMGAELGIPPTAALRGLYVVEGRIFMSADLMVALVMRSPVCEAFDLVESTDQIATYEVQRAKGKPTRFSFSKADKEKAGLKNVHDKYPATMLRHRAAAIACRAIFPDVTLGIFADEEREDFRDVTPIRAVEAKPIEVAVEQPDPEARLLLEMTEAATLDALDQIAAEIPKSYPDRAKRPASLVDGYKQAKARIEAGTANGAA
jgi:hypothetical protein